MAWATIFESYRRNYPIKQGYEFVFLTPMPNLSAYWLLIQYCLIGIGEVFCIVGLLEFLYHESLDAMRSIGSAYAALASGLGCFAVTILNNIVKFVTGNSSKGQPSWLSQNINTIRFDYLYWLLIVLSVINFCVLLYAARRRKLCLLIKMEEADLYQKTNIEWLCFGEKCNAFFFNAIKEKKSRSVVWCIKDKEGYLREGQMEVKDAFIEYYKDLLGVTSPAFFVTVQS
ncbi:hypothetical protein IFM89_004410 [Coptis chinensis]|uniref:Uncharacterized protein n=1 Tax=Coptis chinensis TaxID=261450 RepID=A0A835IMP1_9MAGN|nr:hypothetical protein IFM89_004410 [Coptis chinensis]